VRTSRRPQDQSGFTLVELLVAMPIAMIVLTMALLSVATVVRNEQRQRDHKETLQAQQVGMEQLTRELREATTFTFLTSQIVEFNGWVRSSGTAVQRRIRYDCSSGTHCIRQEGPTNGAVSGERVLIDALENPDVFDPQPNFANPRYVSVIARVRIPGDRHLITLRDGIDLRNLTSRF
jgi:Tfp pilus assembly protein PilW